MTTPRNIKMRYALNWGLTPLIVILVLLYFWGPQLDRLRPVITQLRVIAVAYDGMDSLTWAVQHCRHRPDAEFIGAEFKYLRTQGQQQAEVLYGVNNVASGTRIGALRRSVGPQCDPPLTFRLQTDLPLNHKPGDRIVATIHYRTFDGRAPWRLSYSYGVVTLPVPPQVGPTPEDARIMRELEAAQPELRSLHYDYAPPVVATEDEFQ